MSERGFGVGRACDPVDEVPVVGRMRYAPNSGGGYAEVTPPRCPAGHVLGLGRVLLGQHYGARRRLYTCVTCQSTGASGASWSVADQPVIVTERFRPGDAVEGAVVTLELHVHGVLVGDLDYRLCMPCRLGVIEHMRIAADHRRRGLGTQLVRTVLDRHAAVAWTTSPVAPGAAQFWEVVLPASGRPGDARYCAHMRAADDQTS
ncbi:GNAT family N-acetyltransferase [Allokutzneria oryzae]|uniref:GNAT family N-acetyltransferase n=1 Tax=Allokutzneria oryzae TaxID=1378989 RepID=A0ABV6A1G2_9PSEU